MAYHRRLFLLPLILLLTVTGCALPSAQARGTARTLHAAPTPKTLVVCLDVTLSVPKTIVPNSLKLIAREYKEQVHPGSGEFISYVRTIRNNSVNPANNLLLADIPAVHKAQLHQGSNLDPNPIQTQTARHNTNELARQQRELRHAQAVANKYAQKVLHLKVKPDTRSGTDLYACPAVAARLVNPTGQNIILIISDLLAAGSQYTDFSHFYLPRTRVIVVDYCAQDLRVCNRGEDAFNKVLKKGGVSSVITYDSTQLPILNHLF